MTPGGGAAGAAAFDLLSPPLVQAAVEEALAAYVGGVAADPGGEAPGGPVGAGLGPLHAGRLDGTLQAYPSYANRVYGLRLDESCPTPGPGGGREGRELVAKFYRPGRWSAAALLAEHRLVAELAAAEIPVAAPLVLPGGSGLAELVLEDEASGAEVELRFALYPKRGGRNFDAEGEEDWRRLGSLVGRMHRVGEKARAPERVAWEPGTIAAYAEELLEEGLVHPKYEEYFADLVEKALNAVAPRFEGIPRIRLHGDLHRGNILDRPGEGLLLIDFDDCCEGPAVQDLWLLLPDRAAACPRELSLLLEGYTAFRSLSPRELELVEPLRLMRMIHFLAWRGRQRHDRWFAREFPTWGSEAFWGDELEALREQVEALDQPIRI